MGWLRTMDRRERIPELMDEPGIDPAAHQTALADLARINRLSFSADILWSSLRRLAKQRRKSLRVLDIATGGGDVPIRLCRRAQSAGLNVTFHGCDVSPTAVAVANASALRANANVEFFSHDILNHAIREKYDAITCSLFLHHLSDDEAITVLERMREAATSLVLVNDLDRSATGYALAWIGTRVLSRSPVVHFDGPVSVRAAFTPLEARHLAERAGLKDVRVGRRWPFRFLLTGRPQ